jgi:hypothetical protein
MIYNVYYARGMSIEMFKILVKLSVAVVRISLTLLSSNPAPVTASQ